MYEILVIDDSPTTLKLLQTLLVDENYTLRLATNGSTALTSIRSRQPNLILLDITMPGMTGYEVCRRLKEDPSTVEIPVIVVSGAQDVFDKVKAFSFGAVDYVTKPFQPDELKSRIRTHLKLGTLQQDLLQFNQELEGLVQERTVSLKLANAKLTREIQSRAETEERFRMLVEGTKDYMIVFLNPEGMINSWNEGACRMTGYSSEEIVGHHFSCFYTDEERAADKSDEELQCALAQGSVQEEGVRVRKDRSRFWASVVVTALYDEQGRHQGFSKVIRDITERKKTEEALRKSQEEMQALLAGTASVTGPEFFPVLVQHLAQALHVKYALVTELLEDDKEHTHCLSIRMGDQWGPGFIYSLHDTPCGETIGNGEAYYADNVQSVFPNDQDLIDLKAVSYKGIRLESSEGKPIGHLAILDEKPFVDSQRTQSLFRLFAGRASAELERKRAEVALQESEAYYRSIFENALFGISITGPDFKFEKVNKAWCKLIGYTEDEMLNKMDVADVTVPDDISKSQGIMEQLLNGKINEGHIEKRYKTKSGEIVEAITFVRGIYGKHGKYLGNAASILDITDRKQAEAKLQSAYHRLQNLTRALETAKEEERTRIARELHDEFGQALSSLKWDLACLRRELQSQAQWKEADAIETRIHSMSNLLIQTIHATRRIATSLRPPLLDDLGLMPALEWLVRDFQERTGVSCKLFIDPTIARGSIPSESATAFFRILQELLTNILRHAQASQIDINFQMKDELLLLEVHDNGIGFIAPSIGPADSFGLLGIQERAQALGGHFTIRGKPKGGTQVVVTIPREAVSLPLD